MPFISLLQTTPAGSGSMLSPLLMIVLIFVIMYFFMIRPQQKKQKETEKMIAALKKGDKVITIGGLHGTVVSTKERTVIVKVDDNTKIEFLRSAISTVVNEKVEKEDDAKKAKSKKAKIEDKTEETTEEKVEEKATENSENK